MALSKRAQDALKRAVTDRSSAAELQAQLENAAYAPAAPADWSPAPASVAAALDQLAARVAALE